MHKVDLTLYLFFLVQKSKSLKGLGYLTQISREKGGRGVCVCVRAPPMQALWLRVLVIHLGFTLSHCMMKTDDR